ncbi:hypothetical protein H6G51_09575 [Limnothrix sp. FACHB-708]|uniref:hypothetical protein n=1 Tax=unclassified Limnothrix TaxID=2632864 RepID=UPI0016816D85|nr:MULTISPECIES: hypothetical protein [unclassified Limnothrix]MBD2159933.1 hypothetical protein [Limnothrix sp. FACHB-1083]MBD2190633.1 hypothetical protein [Limnothrix sp. FACHB-1088]MBD2553525.1 hypothetical protein [Limnothrix sp. FACHB-708]MBD2590564.1 hypothetical protein [Limnothrix sp. FACHB-406]
MNSVERLIVMAEDELTEFSTDARKVEKLRRKIGLTLSAAEQRQAKEQLKAELAEGGQLAEFVEKQRQSIALPFWGVTGLGLLIGVSMEQPAAFVFVIAGTLAAWTVQKWGWRLQAKRLILNTLEDLTKGGGNGGNSDSAAAN